MAVYPPRGTLLWDTPLKVYIDAETGARLDAEQVMDLLGTTGLVAGQNITLAYDDATGTILVSAAASVTDPEVVRDTMAAALVAGANVTITPNDAGDTITIAATAAGAPAVVTSPQALTFLGHATSNGANANPINFPAHDAGDLMFLWSGSLVYVNSLPGWVGDKNGPTHSAYSRIAADSATTTTSWTRVWTDNQHTSVIAFRGTNPTRALVSAVNGNTSAAATGLNGKQVLYLVGGDDGAAAIVPPGGLTQLSTNTFAGMAQSYVADIVAGAIPARTFTNASNVITYTIGGDATPAYVPESINAQVGAAYTLVLGDAGKFVTMTNAAASTLTIPLNSAVAFPIGTTIDGAQLGAGQVTITPTAGVTISATPGLKVAAQYGTFGLLKTGTDTWLAYGRLAA